MTPLRARSGVAYRNGRCSPRTKATSRRVVGNGPPSPGPFGPGLLRPTESLRSPGGRNSFLEQFAYVSASAFAIFSPVGIPVRAVRAGITSGLATFDPLATEADLRFGAGAECPRTFQASSCQDQEAAQLMLIEFLDRFDEIPVERHAALRQPRAVRTAGWCCGGL